MKKILLFAATAAMVFTSCLMDSEGDQPTPITGGDKDATASLVVKINRAAATRGVEVPESSAADLEVENGYIFFFNSESGVIREESAPLNMTEASGSGQQILGIPAATTVFVIANIPNFATEFADTNTDGKADHPASLTDADEVYAYAAELADVADYKKAPLATWVDLDGTGAGTDFGFEASPISITPSSSGGPSTATVDINLKPVIARVELAKLTGAGKIAHFTVTGVFLDNYYTDFTFSGGRAGTNVKQGTGLLDDVFQETIGGETVTGDKNTLAGSPADDSVADWATATGSNTTTGKTVTPGSDKVWAYKVAAGTATNPSMPSIIIRLENVTTTDNSYASTQGTPVYLKISGYSEGSTALTTFAPGKVYNIANITFDETNILLNPITDKVQITAKVTVGEWDKLQTDVVLDGDGYQVTLTTNQSGISVANAITSSASGPQREGDPITLTALESVTLGSGTPAEKTYFFTGWELGGGMTAADLTEGTTVSDLAIKFLNPGHNDWTITANYVDRIANPKGEVKIGDVYWAMTNLSAYQTFADNAVAWSAATDNAYFLFGSKTAYAWSAGSMPGAQHSTNTEWPASEDPCPQGWRLPTGDDFANLINLPDGTTAGVNGTMTGEGNSTGGSASGTGQFWGTAAADGSFTGNGLYFKSKSGDPANDAKTLYFPITGRWTASWASTAGGYYWSSSSYFASLGSALGVDSGYTAGYYSNTSKALAMPVRCVHD